MQYVQNHRDFLPVLQIIFVVLEKEQRCNDHFVVCLQAQKEHGVEDPYYCLSDFVAPLDTGLQDYIGCFAVSVMGAEDMAAKYAHGESTWLI